MNFWLWRKPSKIDKKVLDIIFSKDTNKQIRAVKTVHIKSELYEVRRKLVSCKKEDDLYHQLVEL